MESFGSTGLLSGIVIGALGGLVLFAVTWAARVLNARRRTQAADGPGAGRWVVLLLCAAVTGFAFVKAKTGRLVHSIQTHLSSDSLFSVMPRPGFLPIYSGEDPEVTGGSVLVEFQSEGGPDEIADSRTQLKILHEELELAKAQPLEADPGLLRVYEIDSRMLQQREARLKELSEQRDTLGREAARQELENERKRHETGQLLDALAYEDERDRVQLEYARKELDAVLDLRQQGIAARSEVDAKREKVSLLESQIEARKTRRTTIVAERASLDGLTEKTEGAYRAQLAAIETAIPEGRADLESARAKLERTRVLLEGDTERAARQRDKRVRQIEIRMADLERFLANPSYRVAVKAPFDARVGFRDPSPASRLSDGSPLLILYEEGKIWALARLPHAEREALSKDLAIAFTTSGGDKDAETFSGYVAQRKLLETGDYELRVACDPPAKVVKQLARGERVAVNLELREPSLLDSGAATLSLGLAVAPFGVAFLLVLLWPRRIGARGGDEDGEASDGARPRGGDEDRQRGHEPGDEDGVLEYVPELGVVEHGATRERAATAADAPPRPQRQKLLPPVESFEEVHVTAAPRSRGQLEGLRDVVVTLLDLGGEASQRDVFRTFLEIQALDWKLGDSALDLESEVRGCSECLGVLASVAPSAQADDVVRLRSSLKGAVRLLATRARLPRADVDSILEPLAD